MLLIYDKFADKSDLEAGRKIKCVLKHVVSCVRSRKINGLYELEIQSIIDDDIKNYVREKNIIKSPSGQFYIIYWYQYNSNTQLVTIKAKHIFYYLAARPVIHHERDDMECYWSIRAILEDYPQPEGFIKYDFYVASHIEGRKSWNYWGKQQAYAILGDPNSLVNLYGGELYRDNFYFSIESKMEHSRENAFLIRDGWNTTGITCTVDDSNTTTTIDAYDNGGNFFQGAIGPGTIPYSTQKILTFSYSDMSQLSSDAYSFWQSNQNPARSFDVQLASIRNTNKESPWMELENYGIGDSGTVYSNIIGYSETQRIEEDRFDELSQRMISVKLGSYRNSITNKDRYDKLLNKDDSAGRRLDAIEKNMKGNITRDDIQNLFS